MVEHVLAKDETGVRFSYSAHKKFLMKLDIETNKIPKYVTHVTETLKNNGFQAFLVGGPVRDLIINRDIKDWDITTNAKPEQIQSLFEKTIYENSYGTVGVCIKKEDVTHETLTEKYDIVEVTPFRVEGNYKDFRHPEHVYFSDKIEDDLQRRDFTMNALAFDINKSECIDLYNGQKDIKDKIIRAVGNPHDRFNEDALRMLRAVRFSTVLGFKIEGETLLAISQNAHLIQNISQERIRDEFVKIIESSRPDEGIDLLQKLGLLKYIIPELEEGIDCHQGGAHIYDVYEHLIGALRHAADKNYSTNVRLSALFHDIGKPRTKRTPNPKAKPTFYGHEVVGAKMTKKIMERMKFSRETIDYVSNMVRRHMFFSDTEQITLSAVRRVVANVGSENIWQLMEVRECDRVGMSKTEAPYRLRKYHAMIEQVLRDPISVSQLKIDGNTLIEMGEKPGPKFNFTLHALLEEVLDDPKKNTEEYLKSRAKELLMLPIEELKILGEKAKEKKQELEEEEIAELNKKHKV